MSITLTAKFAAAVLATAVIASAAMPSTPAEAKKFFVKSGYHHHHFHHRYYGYRHLYLTSAVVVGSGSCYWLKVRAINTGSPALWAEYRECRGY